jgi:hypothetical protein
VDREPRSAMREEVCAALPRAAIRLVIAVFDRLHDRQGGTGLQLSGVGPIFDQRVGWLCAVDPVSPYWQPSYSIRQR